MSLLTQLPKKTKYGTFKHDEMVENYMREFRHLQHAPIKILELGIFMGGSLKFWEKYFPNGQIAGVDLKVPGNLKKFERIHCFAGEQQDAQVLDQAAPEVAPDGFDIIIDDCAHIGELAKTSFWHLFEKHLKPGGVYVIEDWITGYYSEWHDGRSMNYDPRDVPPVDNVFHGHQIGLAGFIKELIDEFARPAFCIPDADMSRHPRFSEMKIFKNHVFVYKPHATGASGENS